MRYRRPKSRSTDRSKIRHFSFTFNDSELACELFNEVSMLMNMNELKVGEVLKKLMAEGRHTLSSISRATGVPKSTISEWLTNRSPNPVHAVKVARHLGVSLHFLLFAQEDSEEPLHRLLTEDLFSGTFEINIKRVKISKKEG